MKADLSTGLNWYAIIVGGWNLFNRGTTDPVGTLTTKMRQLEKIGYIPIVVSEAHNHHNWGNIEHIRLLNVALYFFYTGCLT